MSTFLQSSQWAEFQKSLGREVFSIDQPGINAVVIKHGLPFGFNYLYIPHGPQIDFNALSGGFNNPFRQFISQLRNLARQENSMFIKIEPLLDSTAQLLVKYGFRKSGKEIHPHKTIIINLQQSADELLAAMHHKTRYNIKVAENHGLNVQDLPAGEAGRSDNVDKFLKLIRHTADKKNFGIHPEWYYKKLLDYFSLRNNNLEAKLFLVEKDDKAVAGAIVLLDHYKSTGYYLHGASDYRSRSLMAPYLLHWHIMRTLQQSGFASYDLWGIDSSKWPGVTRFKLGWGGRQVEYPGSFDLSVSRFWYLVYKTYRTIFK